MNEVTGMDIVNLCLILLVFLGSFLNGAFRIKELEAKVEDLERRLKF